MFTEARLIGLIPKTKVVKPTRQAVDIKQTIGGVTTTERKNVNPTKVAAAVQAQTYRDTLAKKQAAGGVQFKPAVGGPDVNPYKTLEEAQKAYDDEAAANGGTASYNTRAYLERFTNPGAYASTQASDSFRTTGGRPQVSMAGPDGKPLQNPYAQGTPEYEGVIKQGAAKRLRDAGKSEDDIQRIIADPSKIREVMSNTGQGGSFDPVTGAYIPPSQVENDPVFLGPDAAQRSMEYEAAKAASKKAEVDLQNSKREAQKSKEAASQTQTEIAPDGTVTKTGDTPPTLPGQTAITMKLRASGPEGALLADALEAQIAENQQSQSEAQTLQEQLTGKVNETFNDVKSQLDQMKTEAVSNADLVDDLLKEIRDDNADQLAEQQKAADQQLVWSNEKATRGLEKQKTAQHEAMVANAALGGASFQPAEINAINESDNAFETQIAEMQIQLGYDRTDLAVKYSGLFVQNNNSYRNGLIDNFKDVQSKLTNIAFNGIANTQAKGTAEQKILQEGFTTMSNLRKDYAANNVAAVKEMNTIINQKRDDDRAQEKLGWERLFDASAKYGSFAPNALIESIAKQLPSVDVKNVLGTMTLAEMKQFKIKSGGGGSSSMGNYVGASKEEATAASLYDNITPQNLRESVDRVTLSFGGTGEERNRKRSEYLNRIASGESTASIVRSMEADYWVSQKGAEKTRHDGRVDAQGAAESLQQFVDYYGINGNDDGPLGRFDSKVQAVKSWFGQSSQEYNNLATNVGNIRAKIIKENYGAAVTEQELKIAESYIPSMNDKGDQFVTKLQNLKSYNAYLEAKQFAMNVGLPTPKPPLPISMSGNEISGPGKYATEDILSAMK